MPDDSDWRGDDWNDDAEEQPEPGIFTLHKDDVDEKSGQPRDDVPAPSPFGQDRPAASLDDDVLAAAGAFDVPAFGEPTGDPVDDLFSDAIASQVAGQERIADTLEELRRQIARVAGNVEEVRGDLASQYSAQSAQVLFELDERLARVEATVADVSAAVATISGRMSDDVQQLSRELSGVTDTAAIEEIVADLLRAVEAGRDAAESARRSVDELATGQESLRAAQVGEIRTSVRDELHEQLNVLQQMLADSVLDSGDSADAVAQLRGTIAALADDVADIVAGSSAGVTRADIEGLELALERLVADRGPGEDSSVTRMLASQANAIARVTDAVNELSEAIHDIPDAAAAALTDTQSGALSTLERLGAEVRAVLAQATGPIADTLAKESSEGRRELREAINRVRSLEASLVNYLVERDERIAHERAQLAAEVATRLGEGLSKRQRTRLARQVSQSEIMEVTEPRRSLPSPTAESVEEITPSRREGRRPRPRDQAAASRPDPSVHLGVRRMAAEEEPDDEPVEQPPDQAAAPSDEVPAARRPRPQPQPLLGTATPKRPASRGGRPGTDEDREILGRVKGVGPARQDQLLETFGSVAAIAIAEVADIAAIPGISDRLAREIRRRARRATA